MTFGPAPLEVGGYVLAGGQSSRMGRDKALLPLGGKPLLQHAVAKLGRVCAEVAILSARPELANFGRLVPDLHPGCGPLAGMEAALLDTRFEWNFVLPVDVPFLPSACLKAWLERLADQDVRPGARANAVRVLFPIVEGRPHPTVALLHRSVVPQLTEALARGEYKLRPALERAARHAAVLAGFSEEAGFLQVPAWSDMSSRLGQRAGEDWWCATAAQEQGQARWFANLNTPEEFAEAECHLDALDT